MSAREHEEGDAHSPEVTSEPVSSDTDTGSLVTVPPDAAPHHASRLEQLERAAQTGLTQFEDLQERINARSGRNLFGAIAIGLVLVAVLAASLLFWTPLFVLFCMVFAAFAVSELVTAMRRVDVWVPMIPSVAAPIFVMPLIYYFGAPAQILGVAAIVILVAAWRLIIATARRGDARPAAAAARPVTRPRSSAGALAIDLAAGTVVQLYVTLLASFAVALSARPHGQYWALVCILVTVAADTGAYATGVLIGRHKMSPTISPKKTWEGLVGGLVLAVVVAIMFGWWLLGLSWWQGTIMGVVLTATATIGDLFESYLKRRLGVKDMSSWLPGHGGFLDRLDSVLPSITAAFFIYQVFSP